MLHRSEVLEPHHAALIRGARVESLLGGALLPSSIPGVLAEIALRVSRVEGLVEEIQSVSMRHLVRVVVDEMPDAGASGYDTDNCSIALEGTFSNLGTFSKVI